MLEMSRLKNLWCRNVLRKSLVWSLLKILAPLGYKSHVSTPLMQKMLACIKISGQMMYIGINCLLVYIQEI